MGQQWPSVSASDLFFSGLCQICMTLAQRWRNVVNMMPTVSQLFDHISTIFQRWANVVMLSGPLPVPRTCMLPMDDPAAFFVMLVSCAFTCSVLFENL